MLGRFYDDLGKSARSLFPTEIWAVTREIAEQPQLWGVAAGTKKNCCSGGRDLLTNTLVVDDTGATDILQTARGGAATPVLADADSGSRLPITADQQSTVEDMTIHTFHNVRS